MAGKSSRGKLGSSKGPKTGTKNAKAASRGKAAATKASSARKGVGPRTGARVIRGGPQPTTLNPQGGSVMTGG